MKRNLFLVLALVSFVLFQSCSSFKMTSESNFSFLKGANEINAEFDYSDFGVGDYDKEADYVARKVADYEEDEKGKGEKWKKNW